MPQLPNKTVLIVEDEPSILETTRFILETEGYSVLAAHDGAEALAMLEREHPRVVLLDLMLPDHDGIELCRAIRLDPRLSQTFVAVLTAKGLKRDEQEARAAGADAYLRKPFEEEAVLGLLDGVFGHVAGGAA